MMRINQKNKMLKEVILLKKVPLLRQFVKNLHKFLAQLMYYKSK